MNGNYIIAKNKRLVPKMREETSIYLNKYKLTSTVYGHVLFKKYRVKYLDKKKSFNEGKMYLALGRVTSIHDFFLVGSCNCSV